MDTYNSIFEINFHKINQNCGNLPESFWVDKFQSDHESSYFEKILNPQKSVWGRISTFLMSVPQEYLVWGVLLQLPPDHWQAQLQFNLNEVFVFLKNKLIN